MGANEPIKRLRARTARGASVRRSFAERAVRALIALLCFALCYFLVTRSLALAVVSHDPVRAYRLAPENGRVVARFATSLIESDPAAKMRSEARRLAVLALRKDATAVSAASTLGLVSQVYKDAGRTSRAFKYAQKLSRRDLASQLWAIEERVSREDVSGALHHYDIALRTRPAAADFLFPILASAASNPPVRAALVDMLKTQPLWGENFVRHLSASGPDPLVTAQVLFDLGQARVPVSQEASARVVAALAARGLFDQAWAYYASVSPGARRSTSRDLPLSADLTSPSVFDWNLVSADGITSSIQRGESGGVFDFAAAPSVGGPMLHQMQFLPAGAYRLIGHSSGVDQPDQSRPYWVLACNNGRELGRAVMPNSSVAQGAFSARFIVPSGCRAQTLSFVARPSSAEGGLSGQVDKVHLLPLR